MSFLSSEAANNLNLYALVFTERNSTLRAIIGFHTPNTHITLADTHNLQSFSAIVPADRSLELLSLGEKLIYGTSNKIWELVKILDGHILTLKRNDGVLKEIDAFKYEIRKAHQFEIEDNKRWNQKYLPV